MRSSLPMRHYSDSIQIYSSYRGDDRDKCAECKDKLIKGAHKIYHAMRGLGNSELGSKNGHKICRAFFSENLALPLYKCRLILFNAKNAPCQQFYQF